MNDIGQHDYPKNIEDIKDADDFYPNREFFSCYYICGVSDECCYWQAR